MKATLRRIGGCAAVMSAAVVAAQAASASTVDFGNPMYFTSGNSYVLSNTRWMDYVFTATQSLSVDQVYVVPSYASSASNWPVQLYADSGGVPGALLGTAIIGSPAANQFNVGTLGSPASLTAGSIYHLVVEGPAQGTVFARQISGSNAGFHSVDGSPDPNYQTLSSTDGGSSWSPWGDATLGTSFGVANSTTHQAMGQAYGNSTTVVGSSNGANVGGMDWRGEQFVYDKPSGTVQSLYMRVNVPGSTPGDDLYVHLLDSNNNSLFDGVLVDKNAAVLNSVQNYSLSLTHGPTLVQGDTYRLVVNSPNSSSGAYQLMADVVGGYLTAPAGDMLGLSFGGANSFYIQGTGATTPATWINNDQYSAYDATFQLGVAVPEPTSVMLLGSCVAGLVIRRRRRL